MDKWRRFRSLSRAERHVLLRALALLPLTAVGLRLIGFHRWHSLLVRFGAGKSSAAEARGRNSLERAFLAARMVNIAAREGVYRSNCLGQSLVLWWLLRQEGIASELRIGVRKQARRFQAHAWVERSGVVLNDSDEVHKHYAPFDRSIVPVQAERR